MSKKINVAIGLLGSSLDARRAKNEIERKWRPSVALTMQSDWPIARFHLLYQEKDRELTDRITEEIAEVSPKTKVRLEKISLTDPWDFEEVYAVLYDFSRSFQFKPENEEYLIHITTGSHVAQICLFLLTESRHFPGRLFQTSPAPFDTATGSSQVIDLDLSKYDQLKTRFVKELRDDLDFLKSGIATRNRQFNELIELIELVAIRSDDPILLTGPTGAGKSFLAKKIYELRRKTHRIAGAFVELNCATLRGDGAMSALFGHVKGAFTGAQNERPGLLREANGGILFLDEIGELGIDEQAMLLRAVEEKVFLPLGSDKIASSSFQLICGTNRDLSLAVDDGLFREDLLARINLWTFRMPGLAERKEDIEPNLDYEIEQYMNRTNRPLAFEPAARKRFLLFAVSEEAIWSGNFRDFSASLTRMATLSAGVIDLKNVEAEIVRLTSHWSKRRPKSSETQDEKAKAILQKLLGPDKLETIDRFDLTQLLDVIRVCMESKNLSESGRKLFGSSRQTRSTQNDADRLRKYLQKFGLKWDDFR